jgi:hypothetical protein
MSRSERHGVIKGGARPALAVVALVVLSLAVIWARGMDLKGGIADVGPSPTPVVSMAGGPGGVMGVITAGPVCPVEQSPPDPKCAPRPVAGAVLVAKDAIGNEVGRTTSLADGSYRMPVGLAETVTITALPVTGLMSAPAPVSVTFPGQMDWETLNLEYDTGIR